MIGLDSNVVLRFLAQDDKVQSPIATRFMSGLTAQQPGFISCVVLAEITWVLSKTYKSSRDVIADAVDGLLGSAEIIVENAVAAHRALAIYRTTPRSEYGDALIAEIATLAGSSETVTFDRNAATSLGMRLLG